MAKSTADTCFFSGSSTRTSGLQMDPDLANQLFETSANLILLDFPVGTEFGIDMNIWNTGERFKGVKMIPAGIHFVFYSAVNKEGQTAPRTGFFHDFSRGELIARRYNPKIEDVEDINSEDLDRLRQNIRNLEPDLGAYPYDSWKKWVSLTNRISSATISRLEPKNGKIQSVTELVPGFHFTSKRNPELNHSAYEPGTSGTSSVPSGSAAEPSSSGNKRQSQTEREDEKLPKMHYKPGTEIRYTHVPTERYPKGSTPAQMTEHSMDSSYQLELYMEQFQKLYGDRVSSSMADLNQLDEILGEVQFCFICFLVGQHYDSFEHWKKILKLLCFCDKAIAKYPKLYMELISDLHFQIREVPDDFFVDIVSHNNFLVAVLTQLFSNINANEDIDKNLKSRAGKFQQNLSKKFDWDFDAELEDEAPVVVELD